jgi:hypothetical protein
MEDDVYQTSNFTNSIWNEIISFINDTNNKWDFITLDPILGVDLKNKLERYSDLFFKIDCFLSTGMIIYNRNFFKNNISILKSYPVLDTSMTHNKDFIKLTYKKLLVRQYTDKPSSVSGIINTDYYNNWWNETEDILKNANKKL